MDGKALARLRTQEIKSGVLEIMRTSGRRPALKVLMVGDDPASAFYVKAKERLAEKVGINSRLLQLPVGTSTEEIISEIRSLNQDDETDAVLVQMPLPPSVDSQAVISAIAPEKDADGFHPLNLGGLLLNRRVVSPCTPAGIMDLLVYNKVPLAGRHAVIVGRSYIVGKPLAAMLLNADATVTVCHSHTRDLPGQLNRADIVVAALGRPAFVRAEMVKAGAVVIDVGINRVEDAATAEDSAPPSAMAEFARQGYLLVGDCHWRVYEKSAAYTPVPGGVGPMTVVMLMANTLELCKRRLLNGHC